MATTPTLAAQNAPTADPFELKRRALGLPYTFTKDECAQFGRRSVRSVERAIHEKRLPAFRSDGGSSRTLILVRDVLAWLGVGAEGEGGVE